MSGDFGGLAGADMFCQQLAQAVSLGNKTWRAYLSTSNVNARDRIGTGPWFNSLGESVTMVIGFIFVVCVLAFRRGIMGEAIALVERWRGKRT